MCLINKFTVKKKMFPEYKITKLMMNCANEHNFVKWPHEVIIIPNTNIRVSLNPQRVSYFATLAHRSYEERMLQRDIEASAGDADIWTNTL